MFPFSLQMVVQFYIHFPLPLQFLLRLTVSVDVLGLQSLVSGFN